MVAQRHFVSHRYGHIMTSEVFGAINPMENRESGTAAASINL
jgi:hypothetical protein